jgi:putative endonuclease
MTNPEAPEGPYERGLRGEDVAADYLERKGYRVLERRYRFERSEVDLVCFHPSDAQELGGEIVFVEVKARWGERFGRPEESVTPKKQSSIIDAARAYLYETKLEGARCRFDVVAVSFQNGQTGIEHFEDAFQ